MLTPDSLQFFSVLILCSCVRVMGLTVPSAKAGIYEHPFFKQECTFEFFIYSLTAMGLWWFEKRLF